MLGDKSMLFWNKKFSHFMTNGYLLALDKFVDLDKRLSKM